MEYFVNLFLKTDGPNAQKKDGHNLKSYRQSRILIKTYMLYSKKFILALKKTALRFM